MANIKQIRAIGNSAGVVLDAALLRQLNWQIGQDVEIRVEYGQVVISQPDAMPDDVFQRAKKRVFTEHGETIRLLSK